MATETYTRQVDDVDGSAADRTVRFSWEGTAYEIDLSKKNANAFEKALAPYLSAARKSSNGRRATTRGRGRGKAGGNGSAAQRAEIRSWAQQQGYSIGDRGRIAQEIIDAFESANA
ncbi:MAG: Lsr2 family protein [Actinobacteria bacterium]|nr:Lsr2 family protein [Actinomycetota bacterium]